MFVICLLQICTLVPEMVSVSIPQVLCEWNPSFIPWPLAILLHSAFDLFSNRLQNFLVLS